MMTDKFLERADKTYPQYRSCQTFSQTLFRHKHFIKCHKCTSLQETFDHISSVLRELKQQPISSMLVYRDGILAFQVLKGVGSRLSGLKKISEVLKFTTETRATRIRQTFPATELPQAKGPFIIGPFHCGTLYPKGSLRQQTLGHSRRKLCAIQNRFSKQSIFKTGLLIIFLFLGNTSVSSSVRSNERETSIPVCRGRGP